MFLCKVHDKIQGVIVIKLIKVDNLEDIQIELKHYETLLASQKIVFHNNECVIDVYDVKYDNGGVL